MITLTNGNMFDNPADIRINTVNCVGVMGAGVALEFKNKYPEMFKDYKKACTANKIRPGKPHVWSNNNFCDDENVVIVNFPTKDHWRKPSEYQYIEDGLNWLHNFLKKEGNVTITIPALGCGHGGLDWAIVKNMIKEKLVDLKANILVFEPADSHSLGNTLNKKEV